MPCRPLARLLAGVLGLVLLAACRVDATVELVIGSDGTGSLTVTAVADAEVVEQAPGLAGDLRFEDAVAAGWTVEGPAATEEGGLRVTLAHAVTSAAEATNLLASLGPPFTGMRLDRQVGEDGETATTTLTGQLVLAGGFDAFADSDVLAAVGGSPFADELAAAGATPASSMAVSLRASLPGDVEQTDGREVDGAHQWDAPLDGSTTAVQLRTVQRPPGAGTSLLATTLLVLLVVWLVAATAFIVSVGRARARRAQRRRRALSRLR